MQPWASVTHTNVTINYAPCLAKLIVGQLISKLPVFYETRRFATGHYPKHVESKPHNLKVNVYTLSTPWRHRWEIEGLASLILNPSAKWPWVVNSTSRRFTPVEGTGHPLNLRLGGLQTRAGRFRKKKNLLLLPSGLKPRNSPPPGQLVA